MPNIDTTYCQPANLLPHFWFDKIVDKDGRADLACIMLFSEIFGWFRRGEKEQSYYRDNKTLPRLKDAELAVSYEYLTEKLNLQRERIRKSFVKLEQLGLLVRHVRNVLEDGTRKNKLFVRINKEFFVSCFRDQQLDIRLGEYEAVIIDTNVLKNEDIASTRNDNDHISKKNKDIKNRSIRSKKSNFAKNISKKPINREKSVSTIADDKTNHQKHRKDQHYQPKARTPRIHCNNTKKLKDFYPLNREDCLILQKNSGREFVLGAMNEILLDMSTRVSDRFFYSRKGFIAYMSQAFMHEMRDAEKTSSETFKIRSNIDSEAMEIAKEEKYLSEIESCPQVSPEWHLKKKLASMLERGKAYNLLTSYKYLEIGKDGICRLVLSKHVDLTENDQDIILSQVKATHEKLDSKGNYQSLQFLELVMPDRTAARSSTLELGKNSGKEIELPKNIWGKVRSRLIDYFGANGNALDKAWFSKVEANIDKASRTLSLRTQSSFTKDWIAEKYGHLLEKFCHQDNYSLEMV